jgi:hypothetical protein
MGRDGERGGESGEILFLGAAVDLAAEVWEANGAISEVGKWGRGIRGREMGGEEGQTSGAKEGALATGLGGSGKEVHALGKGEVGDRAGRVRDAVRGKENGVGIGDYKVGRGCQCGRVIVESTKANGKLIF